MGSVSDRFDDILGSFGGSFGDHLGVTFSIFWNSVLELKLHYTDPLGVETFVEVDFFNHGS